MSLEEPENQQAPKQTSAPSLASFIAELKKRKAMQKGRHSKLDKHIDDIDAILKSGGGATDIYAWFQEKKFKVHLTTIYKYLDKRGKKPGGTI